MRMEGMDGEDLCMCTDRRYDEVMVEQVSTATSAHDLELWSRLEALTGRINQRLDQLVTERSEIALSEFFTLRALIPEGERGARVQDVAHAVGINASTMSRVVTRLEARGLVQRVTCDVDRRGVYCAITADGRSFALEVEEKIAPDLARLLDEAALDMDTAAIVTRLRHTPR